MKIEDLGYNKDLEKARVEHNLDGFGIGRVIAEHKERYIVWTESGELEAEISGTLRYTSVNREDFPAVGDWVAASTFDSDLAIIHEILPRFSMIKRQAVGQYGETQIIATNIDCAFIVQAVDRDFNINRLERYLTICDSSRVSPLVILTKVDLADEARLSEIEEQIEARLVDIPVIAISNKTGIGYDALKQRIQKGLTYCLLGSSGVGKSTLLNNLSGRAVMQTDTISQSTGKGRHTTSHRELIILDQGGILIDNPGMREVGIADTSDGLENTFRKIIQLAQNCKFKDCTHTNETDCSVIEALEKGELERDSYENYLKLEREKAHFESTLAERRKKDKEFGKMVKNFKNNKNSYL